MAMSYDYGALTKTFRYLTLLLLLGCTDAALREQPPPGPPPIDNKITLTGQVCTQPPNEVVFPIKVLFVIDESSSLQLCTDPAKKRIPAIEKVISQLAPEPNVKFGFIGFSSWIRIQNFTNDPSKINEFLSASKGQGPATDYQGALATIGQVLENDLIDSGPIRARTNYVVIFISDGIPEPQCIAGCEDDIPRCSDGEDNDGDGKTDLADDSCPPDLADIDASLYPDTLYGQCNSDVKMDENTYVDYGDQGSCPDYNRDYQILDRLESILELKNTYSAGSVVFNTVLLTTDEPQILAKEDCQQLFGYSTDKATALLTQMAALGGGIFQDVNLAGDLTDAFKFDYSTLQSAQRLIDFLAINRSARMLHGELVPDSDMDGLPDKLESTIGTMFNDEDTDGDLYEDLVEHVFAQLGFNATDELQPALGCGDGLDLDGDGLPDCVEGFVGTETRAADTDGDGIIDWLELALGTDPLFDDALLDPDFDGVLTRDEIRAGTDPITADPENWQNHRAIYNLLYAGETEDGRNCYDFTVDELELAITPMISALGRNRILMYSLERPVTLINAAPTVQVACVEVSYEGEGSKAPADGQVNLTEKTWQQLLDTLGGQLFAIRDCVGPESGYLERNHIELIIDECLPQKLALAGYLLSRQELKNLLRRYLDSELSPLFPTKSSELFKPLEKFVPELHCYRPAEVDQLLTLTAAIRDACGVCDFK